MMQLGEALVRLEQAERDVLAVMARLFPEGSAVTLDFGTDERPLAVAGEVVRAVSSLSPGERLMWAVRLGERGCATLVSLNTMLEQGERQSATALGG